MAELLSLNIEMEKFQKDHLHRSCQAEEDREKENQAATQIQGWFRACRVRAYLSHLHKKAVIIQKMWRGFLARARVRQMVKAEYFIMKMNFYEEMAVRIQCRWRGFFTRKYIHNFYARKTKLQGFVLTNCQVRKELDEFEELQEQERNRVKMLKQQQAKVYQAYRLHHLVSTKQCPGVFNSPFRAVPHEMELLLRQVKYTAPTKVSARGRACLLGSSGSSLTGTLESPVMKFSISCSSKPVLPPIKKKKEKSLVRGPGEVWEQRVHCPHLMSCLQTSYMNLEDAENQLQQYESMILPSVTQ